MKSFRYSGVCASICVAAALACRASGVVLYDGALGTAPNAQGFLSYGAVPSGPFFATGPTSVTLNSSSSSAIYSGFTNYNLLLTGPLNAGFPVLNRAAGFTVSVDMRTVLESHNTNDRAGFSLIALGSDHVGIEIGFWGDTVWAQNGIGGQFKHSPNPTESTAFDTTATIARYNLTILGNTYTLTTGATTLLSGPVQDYSALPANPPVYGLPNFLFIGDDTSSASGGTEVSRLAVATGAVGVPLPAAIGPAGLAIGVLAVVAMRIKRRPRVGFHD